MAPSEGSSRTLPIAVLVVALAAFLAHYSLSHGLGLYEDDYWAVGPHLGGRPSDLGALLVRCFTQWPQGRPLNHFLPPMLAVLGSRLGGLQGVYALAAAWLTLNGALVFLLVRRLLSPAAGLVAAAAYVLFPADSTKVLLIHASEHQGAMTFLLLGSWLWLRGGAARVASYPVAGAALLAFETAFLPFLTVPLLGDPARRRSFRAWAGHLAACVLLVALDAAVRLAKGESRALEAVGQGGQTLWRAFSSLGIGPWTSGGVLARSIGDGWQGADPHALLSALLFAGVLGLALGLLAGGEGAPPGEAAGRPSCAAALVAGLVAWVSSYALTLVNYPPTQTTGRLTSTHIAAAWGVVLALAASFEAARRRARRPASAAAVALLASWLLYQHGIQRQFVDAWALQSRFWGQVLALAPEVRGGWTVLVDGNPAPSPPAILANSWADILAYRLLVKPEAWEPSPSRRASGSAIDFGHLGHVGWAVELRRDGDRVEWRPEFWAGPVVAIDPDRLALLHDEGGVLTRVQEVDTPAGRLRARAPIPPPGPGRPAPGPVGELMLGR